MNRTLNVIRMQLVNRQTYLWVPLIILGASFLMTLAIYALIRGIGGEGPMYGGGAQAPLWYFGVVGIQALSLTFPFSQAMSVTRREFYLGTLLTAMLTSAILAAIFIVGGLIESATGGLGIGGYFFYFPWIWAAGPAAAGLFYFSVAMMFFVVGFWAATIYRRFGGIGLTATLVGIGVALTGVLFLIIQAGAWTQLFTWVGSLGVLGLTLCGVIVIAMLAAISFLTLRRATP